MTIGHVDITPGSTKMMLVQSYTPGDTSGRRYRALHSACRRICISVGRRRRAYRVKLAAPPMYSGRHQTGFRIAIPPTEFVVILYRFGAQNGEIYEGESPSQSCVMFSLHASHGKRFCWWERRWCLRSQCRETYGTRLAGVDGSASRSRLAPLVLCQISQTTSAMLKGRPEKVRSGWGGNLSGSKLMREDRAR